MKLAIAIPQIPPSLELVTDLSTLTGRDETLSGALLRNQDISGLHVKAMTLNECRLEKVIASEADLARLGLSDVALERSDFTATNCADASWLRVSLRHVRGSGLKLQTSTLKDVVFEDCKLDLANFRFAKLKNVLFKDCILDEADFYMAELENVSFQTSSLARTILGNAKLKQVDLRTSDISTISGISGLAGATIDSIQLIVLATQLANELQILVRDE